MYNCVTAVIWGLVIVVRVEFYDYLLVYPIYVRKTVDKPLKKAFHLDGAGFLHVGTACIYAVHIR